MLNKEIHKEQVQSLKFKLQSGYENLTSAFGMQGHPELDSGSDAWGLEPGACSYLSPQKPFAYEACLTRMKNEKLKMKNVENCQSSNSNLQYNGCCTENRLKFLNTNISISINFLHLIEGEYPEYSGGGGAIPSLYPNASILIDLHNPYSTNCNAKCRKANFVLTMVNADRLKKEVPGFLGDNFEAHRYKQTQTEKINSNKNRIDKQLIHKRCQSTNKTKTFCDLNADILLKQTRSNLAPARQEHEFLPRKRGSVPDPSADGGQGEGVVFPFSPHLANRTVLTKN